MGETSGQDAGLIPEKRGERKEDQMRRTSDTAQLGENLHQANREGAPEQRMPIRDIPRLARWPSSGGPLCCPWVGSVVPSAAVNAEGAAVGGCQLRAPLPEPSPLKGSLGSALPRLPQCFCAKARGYIRDGTGLQPWL